MTDLALVVVPPAVLNQDSPGQSSGSVWAVIVPVVLFTVFIAFCERSRIEVSVRWIASTLRGTSCTLRRACHRRPQKRV